MQAREQYLQDRDLWKDVTYFVNDKLMVEGRKKRLGRWLRFMAKWSLFHVQRDLDLMGSHWKSLGE